jgi:hypothetical protein
MEQIFSAVLGGVVGALIPLLLWLVQSNRDREQRGAEWFSTLYASFFSNPRFLRARKAIDWENEDFAIISHYCADPQGFKPSNENEIEVIECFTDYLNFFIQLAQLVKRNQITIEEAGFKYYIKKLFGTSAIKEYILEGPDGFSSLNTLEKLGQSLKKLK